MIQMTLTKAAEILNAAPPSEDIEFHGISIDTRKIEPGNLFIAIPGENYDGHQFISEAKNKGAVAAIVSTPHADLPQLLVQDTTAALGQLGAYWRKQFNLPIIGITGSNGKTTLKNMIAAIMTVACNNNENQVLATIGTLNNHWGLPLTLLRLNAQHKYAAIEMGMNHFGEIEYLTQLAKPHVAVITNAAASHLEGVKNIAGVARAKAEIFSGLEKDGIAILNRDDAFYTFWREVIDKRQYLTFGFHPDADISATVTQAQNMQIVAMQTPQGTIEINLPLLGKHNVLNTLAAAAACLAINIELDAIKTGLENIRPAAGRLEMHTLANGVNIIDDTYNANPFSLQAAVSTLSTFIGKKIFVLGDMKELGSEEKFLHRIAGEQIRSAGIDFLFTYGELSADTATSFGEGAFHFNNQEKLVEALKPFLYNQTTILVKGSRSMRMEKVIRGLIE